MIQLIECVPNFSEGRNASTINKIAEEISKVRGVQLIGLEMDYDHNRSVLTCIGTPDEIVVAAYNACLKATELIDLRKHRGVHPRIGATDVIPLIPLVNSSIHQCVDLARKLGHRIAQSLNIPVFLYSDAAINSEHKILANIRRGGYEKMFEQSLQDTQWAADLGPSRIHPSAGAVAVGARNILVAYNVNLQTVDIKIARKIAHEIRESSGGLPGIKALGFILSHKQCVQVSINILDFNKTSIADVYQYINNRTHQLGIKILESELIGLAPEVAFGNISPVDLKLISMRPDRYLDYHIKRAIKYHVSC